MNQQERVLSINGGFATNPLVARGGGGGGAMLPHLPDAVIKACSAILSSFDNMTIVHTYISGWGLPGLPMDS